MNDLNKPKRLVCFLHGQESGPWGTKIRHLAAIARDRNWEAVSPDFQHTRDPHERLAELLADPPAAERLVLCGSSLGGYVAAMACHKLKPRGLFLMAPAFYFPEFNEEPADCPPLTAVAHGWRDNIVPPERALRFAEPRRAELHLFDDGHRLIDSLDAIGRLFGDLLDRTAT